MGIWNYEIVDIKAFVTHKFMSCVDGIKADVVNFGYQKLFMIVWVQTTQTSNAANGTKEAMHHSGEVIRGQTLGVDGCF